MSCESKSDSCLMERKTPSPSDPVPQSEQDSEKKLSKRAELLSTLPLEDPVISALSEAGFNYISELQSFRATDLHAATGLSLKDSLAVIKALRKDSNVKSLSSKKVTQDKIHSPKFSTMLKSMDTLLGGGISLGTITEVSGIPGIGKTCLCIQLCISVQLPPSLGGLNGEAVFIDTEGRLRIERMKEMVEHLMRKWSDVHDAKKITVESVLRHIHYFRCHNSDDVQAAIRWASYHQKRKQDIKLIVIDSITFPFLYDFRSQEEHQAQQTNILQEIRDVAINHNMAVVVTNHMIARKNADGQMDLVEGLGESWGHYPTMRVMLHWSQGIRVASLTKAPHLPNASISYQILAAGVQEIT